MLNPMDEGSLGIAALGGKTPTQNPKFEIFSQVVRNQCHHVGLGDVVGQRARR